MSASGLSEAPLACMQGVMAGHVEYSVARDSTHLFLTAEPRSCPLPLPRKHHSAGSRSSAV
jgi:hypothetical protein